MKDKLYFKHLPAYSEFLLQNKVREFVIEQFRILRELDAPIFKYYGHFKDDQLIEQGVQRAEKFLTHVKNNTLSQFIEDSMKEWLADQIPLITGEKLLPEDIIIISFARRKLFRDFLPYYTADNKLSLQIMEEVDVFTVEMDTLSLKLVLDLQAKLYDQAEELAHIGHWVWDLKLQQLIWSDEMFRIFELEPTENANGYDLRSFVHPADLEMFNRETENALKKFQPYDFYYRIVLKNKKEKFVHFKGQSEVYSDTLIKMYGTLQDVTLQKKTEEQLKKNEEMFNSMISEIQDYAIVVLDAEGKIKTWNKGAEKIKGYKTEDVIGKHFRLFYTKEDCAEKLPEHILQLAAREGKATYEGWRKRKNGNLFWGSIVITAVHDKKGNVSGFTKVTRDLTEKKIAEDQLIKYADSIIQKNKKLEQANRELESFNYIASHDLQEPLRKIQAFTSRLLQKENTNLSEWGKDVFSKVQASANRMQKLIEALLSFSRLDKTQELFEPTDINLLLEEVKNTLHDAIESKKVKIEAEQLPVMNVIPIQFQQLLSNLLNNAIKYSRVGVQPLVRITYGLKEGKLIPGNSRLDQSKYHHICITDNGIGFEPQYSEKIFDLFQRLHGKSEYEGTGIGLAICKKIVNRHHGFIFAKGEPGQGAEFNIYIPSERKAEIIEKPLVLNENE